MTWQYTLRILRTCVVTPNRNISMFSKYACVYRHVAFRNMHIFTFEHFSITFRNNDSGACWTSNHASSSCQSNIKFYANNRLASTFMSQVGLWQKSWFILLAVATWRLRYLYCLWDSWLCCHWMNLLTNRQQVMDELKQMTNQLMFQQQTTTNEQKIVPLIKGRENSIY